ncbi:hypothetical protein OAO18_01830 [Francisellaceae bacterium]|nr:hypothetical protein [Francisellaceae bacterium]
MKNTIKKIWGAYLKHNEIYAYAHLQRFCFMYPEINDALYEKQMSLDLNNEKH